MELAPPFPKTIEIETSSLCNLRCVMCPQSLTGEHGIQRPNHLDHDIARKLIPLVSSGETHCVSLHGIGEPFLSKSFWDILPNIHESCMNIQANTNLTVLTDKMLNTLSESNITLLNVSMDSPYPEMYKKIRGFELEVVLDNMRKLVEARDSQKDSRLKIFSNMTLMKCNIDSVIDFLDLVIGDIGIDGAELWPLNNWGTAVNARYYQTKNDWTFDYNEQGQWNFEDEYFERLEDAKQYAKSKQWNLRIYENL